MYNIVTQYLYIDYTPVKLIKKWWLYFPVLRSISRVLIYVIQSSLCLLIPCPTSPFPLPPEITSLLSVSANLFLLCYVHSCVLAQYSRSVPRCSRCYLFGIFLAFDWATNTVLTSLVAQTTGKETACSGRDPGLIPGSGTSPGVGNGNPLQYSCLEKFHGQRSLAGYSPRGHKELDTT